MPLADTFNFRKQEQCICAGKQDKNVNIFCSACHASQIIPKKSI